MRAAVDPRKSYDILENLVVQGFDALGLRLGGASFVFKTMSPREEKVMMYATHGGKGIPKDVFLAWSTFMINGENVLCSRPKVLPTLTSFYAGLPSPVADQLVDEVISLQFRAQKAASLLGGFCVSQRSRSLWESIGTQVNSTRHTGIEGTESLGLNAVQELWVPYNKALDNEEHSKDEMRRAFFIASAMNPKGVDKAANTAESKEKSKAEQREMLARFGSLANRETILDIRRPEQEGWASKLSTNAEMLRELERQMRGEKDRHDLFVESFFKKKAEEAAEAEAVAEAERKANYTQFNPDTMFQGQAAVTVEEMEMAMRGDVDIRDVVAGRERFSNGSSGKIIGHRVIRR